MKPEYILDKIDELKKHLVRLMDYADYDGKYRDIENLRFDIDFWQGAYEVYS